MISCSPRFLAAAGGLLLLAAAGCANTVTGEAAEQVLVVDGKGAPIAGALVLPDLENPPPNNKGPDAKEIKAASTNDQGLVTVPLQDFFWVDDDCYHFRVSHRGYDVSVLSVSRELCPPVLRVELKPPLAP